MNYLPSWVGKQLPILHKSLNSKLSSNQYMSPLEQNPLQHRVSVSSQSTKGRHRKHVSAMPLAYMAGLSSSIHLNESQTARTKANTNMYYSDVQKLALASAHTLFTKWPIIKEVGWSLELGNIYTNTYSLSTQSTWPRTKRLVFQSWHTFHARVFAKTSLCFTSASGSTSHAGHLASKAWTQPAATVYSTPSLVVVKIMDVGVINFSHTVCRVIEDGREEPKKIPTGTVPLIMPNAFNLRRNLTAFSKRRPTEWLRVVTMAVPHCYLRQTYVKTGVKTKMLSPGCWA